MYKPEDVCLGIFALGVLDVVDNIAMAILEMRRDRVTTCGILLGRRVALKVGCTWLLSTALT